MQYLICTKKLLQLLNILIFIEKNKFTMPVCHASMKNKSFLSYQKILKDIKLLVENYNISCNVIKIKFVCDF